MPRRMVNWIGSLALIAFGLLAPLAASLAQEKRPVVYVVPIEGIIDLGLAPFVQRVLDEAAAAGAAAVVLEINTFGGRLDAAVQIRDALLNSKVRTVAFVNKRAISAGALIGLAASHFGRSVAPSASAALPRRRFSGRSLLGTRRQVQNAIVIATILGPCRAYEPHDIR